MYIVISSNQSGSVADTGGGQRGFLTPPPKISSKQDRDTQIEQSL